MLSVVVDRRLAVYRRSFSAKLISYIYMYYSECTERRLLSLLTAKTGITTYMPMKTKIANKTMNLVKK